MIRVPEWDLTDRLRKSLRVAGLNTTEMAEYLGVQRTTINTWTSGRIKPSIATLRAWAMATGVPFEWLRDGGLYDSASGGVRHQGLEPRTRWLRAVPADSKSSARLSFHRPRTARVERRRRSVSPARCAA